MDGMLIIYGLCDPDTGELRYIGKTRGGLAYRLRSHLSQTRSSPQIREWVQSLDKPPTMIVLEAEPSDPLFAEARWIETKLDEGANLLNICLHRPKPIRIKSAKDSDPDPWRRWGLPRN